MEDQYGKTYDGTALFFKQGGLAKISSIGSQHRPPQDKTDRTTSSQHNLDIS